MWIWLECCKISLVFTAFIQYIEVHNLKFLMKAFKIYTYHHRLKWNRLSNTCTCTFIHVNCLSFIIRELTCVSLIKLKMHSWICMNINRDNSRMAEECEALARRLSESVQLESERDNIQALENQSQKLGQEIQLLCGWVSSERGAGIREKFCIVF